MGFPLQGSGVGGSSSGTITVADSHVFADTTARDTYFASHASELVDGLYIYITTGPLLQQYDLNTTSFIDRTPIIVGPSGTNGTNGDSIEVTVASTAPSNPNTSDIWVDTSDSIIDIDPTFTANSDALIPSQKAVKTRIDLVMRAFGNVSVPSHLYNSSGVEKSINMYQGAHIQISASNGDYFTVPFYCDGTETILIIGWQKATTRGIFDLYVNETLDSSGYDGYNASSNSVYNEITLSIATVPGLNVFKLVVNGKNENSTGYGLNLYELRLR